MEKFNRFAIYYVPPVGPLHDAASSWLGWDIIRGCSVKYPDLAGLPCSVADITKTPRKYGFHGTIKPPFKLADGCNFSDLQANIAQLCKGLAPVRTDGLNLTQLGRFLALTPTGTSDDLTELGARVVQELDGCRAPADDAELNRRRMAGLNPRQEAYLIKWGYPYVLEEFKFHLTLSGSLDPCLAARSKSILQPLLMPLLPSPFEINDLALCGEGKDGLFYLLKRYQLEG